MSDSANEAPSKTYGAAIGFSSSIIAAGLASFGALEGNFVSLVATILAINFSLFLMKQIAGTATLSGITEYLFSLKAGPDDQDD